MYYPRTRPRAHQSEALRRIKERPTKPSDQDVFALLMDMGTGKSKVICDEWGERVEAGDLSDLVILAPAGCYRNWDLTQSPEEPGELDKHLNTELREHTRVVPWISGASATQRRSLDALLAYNGPRVLNMNIEALSMVRRARDLLEQFIASSRRGVMLAVDESTTIRSWDADRTKHAIRIGRLARVRRILTGLVTPRSPMDLYSQYEFLDPRILGFRTFHGFRARHAILRKMQFGGRSFWTEVGYRDVDELSEKIAPYSYRVLKDDCLDLDPKVYMPPWEVELTDEQRRLYRELREYATAELASMDYVTATSVITQILRLHQVLCGHVTDETGTTHEVPERRTAALLNILGSHSGKAVIWVPYEHTLLKVVKRLEEEYGEGCAARFWGGNRATRGLEEARFKTDPTCRFMVATPGAGGRGNTWVCANLVIYYANSYDLEHRSQSEDRTHRDGQTSSVTYIDLVARGTVDEKIIKSLRAKINMATAISGEDFREWLI